jgi:ElaB/YqjD/DUF883 family membrane-anchored ribosome-binding protein
MGAWFGSSRRVDVMDEIDAIRSELGSITNRISRVAGTAGDNLRSNVEQLRGNMPSTGEAQDRLSRAARDALGHSREWIGSAEGHVSDGWQQARGSVERNPALALAFAAGIGFLIGLTVRR